MTCCRFAFGAQVGKIIDVDADVGFDGGCDKALYANGLVLRQFTVGHSLSPENADVAERSAKVLRVAGMKIDFLLAPFPPEGGTVGNVAVVASEGFV